VKKKPKAVTNIKPALAAFSQVGTVSAPPVPAVSTDSATAVISALPIAAEPPKPAQEEAQKTGWGKKIKPPSMVLDGNVNGYKSSKRRGGGGGGGGKKNKKVRFLVSSFWLTLI
jgi:splicing factor 45